MKYWLNSGRVHEKIDTGGVSAMVDLVLNNENIPDCKNIFLRETVEVQSAQLFRLRQNIVTGKLLYVHIQKLSNFYLYFDYLISSMVNMYLYEYWPFCH